MKNKEAIKILKKGYPNINRYASSELEAYEYDVEIYNEAIEVAIKALEAQRWIPVSERLPDKFGLYLITDCDGRVMTDVYSNDAKEFQNHEYITHWRPLPEPYTKEETT